MKSKINKKLLSTATLAVLTGFLLSGNVINANSPTNVVSKANETEINVYIPGKNEVKPRVFKAGERLGKPEGVGRNTWYIKTYRKVFAGWSTSKNAISDGTAIFRDADTIEDVISTEGTMNGKVLYPVFISQSQIFDKMGDVEKVSSKLAIAATTKAEEITPNIDIKKSEGFTGKIDSTNRKVTSYFNPEKEKHYISISSQFGWNDRFIPLMVAENPLSVLKGLYVGEESNLSVPSPTLFTYEDLFVELDPEVETSEVMKNLEFKSSLFRVAAVLDENYNKLDADITKPRNDEMITRFSFKNPNRLKKFYIRTVLRNYGPVDDNDMNMVFAGSTIYTAKGKDVLGNMELTSGDPENIWVSKEKALEIAKSGSKTLRFTGSIGGKIVIDKTNLNGSISFGGMTINPADLVQNEYKINTNKSLNELGITFDFNKVTYFENNEKEMGNLGIANVVHNSTLGKDILNENILPKPGHTGDTHLGKLSDYELNGEKYKFVGWNTKRDGKGMAFDENTVVSTDLEVYAQWEKVGNVTKPEPQPQPTPKPQPQPKAEEKPVPTPRTEEVKPSLTEITKSTKKTKDAVDTSNAGITGFIGLGWISLIG